MVRPAGRPRGTPMLSVWLDGALYFCTGESERKAKNLTRNAYCVLSTGSNALDEGLDVIVGGDAARASDEDLLQRVAERYDAKYGRYWPFALGDGAFHGNASHAA